ncbi:hypothetical protein [Nostoc phage Nsp-JY21]
MPNVIKWPPVGLVGWEITRIDRANVERGMLTNIRRSTGSQARRRELVPVVSALSSDATGSGFMQELIEQLDGGQHLIRIDARSSVWHLRDAAARFSRRKVDWLAEDSAEVVWTLGSDSVVWGDGAFPLHGTPGTIEGRPVLTVTGFPPNQLVCRPSEGVRVFTLDEEEQARSVTTARSNNDGVAVIVLSHPISLSGPVDLGARESIVCEAVEMPRAIAPVRGNWTYQWRLREVFEAETGAWVEVDPWAEVTA